MKGSARIYVSAGSAAAGLKTLLKNNAIPFAEIDLTGNTEAQRAIFGESGWTGIPVVEFEGKRVTAADLSVVARELGLQLRTSFRPPPACC